MKIKNSRFQVKADDDWIERLQKTSSVLDRSASQFVREVVTEKIQQLAKRNPKVAKVLGEKAA